MNLLDLLLILLVAIPCGALAQVTSPHSKKGWFLHVAIAFMGGLLGVWIARSFTVPIVYMLRIGNHPFPVIWSLIGSVLLVAGLGWFIRPQMR